MRALLLVAAALIAVQVVVVSAQSDHPVDLPCVTWTPLSYYNYTDPTNLFVAAYTYVIGTFDSHCFAKGDVIPCFASDNGINTWGHHDYQAEYAPQDYCRTWHNNQVYLSTNMYVPTKGPKWHTWKWKLAQSGGTVPDNAIRFGSSVMARSTSNPDNFCCGKGFTGWAVGQENGTFGAVHFSIENTPVTTDTFEVAICEAYKPTPMPPTPSPPTPSPPTGVPPTPSPPTPVPNTPVPPTLPPNNKPYIRFANVIPSPNTVTATITQGSTSYTWTNYGFGHFSKWNEIFASGEGIINIKDAKTGVSLLEVSIPLTPGPLVVVVKDYWPPKIAQNVETVAASYVPTAGKSGVRLFNLSPDTAEAGMTADGKSIGIDKVAYGIGSKWEPIDVKSTTFDVFNDKGNAQLATATTVPPDPPFAFTNFLIGLNNATKGTPYATRVVPLIDAPEH